MKIQLETIPVWDSLKEGGECLLCSLMKKAEEDGVRYYLSSAIMTPEVRVETNRYGFCPHHLDLLAQGGKAQALSLMLDTYYEENRKILYPQIEKIISSSNGRKSAKLAADFEEEIQKREQGCLICNRMNDRLLRYCYTIVSLWNTDPDFRKNFESSKGLCLHHTAAVAKIAPEVLSGNELALFDSKLFSLLKTNLDRVQHDAWWMTQKYKSENQDKPWNGCEDAHRRAAYKLIGQARVLDPVKKK